MSAVSPIQSRIPFDDYQSIPALNISRLKEMKRSPLHYQHALTNPKSTAALTLGTAAHTATLEPERFGRDFAIWSHRTESGRMSPRTGKRWDEFCIAHADKKIITEDECDAALAIAHAVRNDPVARSYLEAGDPEVTMQWAFDGRACKGRVDWLTRLERDVLVGLKSARDCRPFLFGAAAARLGYHLQWAWYFDGFITATGREPRVVEIVVESAPPHAVVVYDIPNDILEQGREEYLDLMRQLADCEDRNEWRGPAETELVLSLPSWVYGADEDIGELELEE